MLYILYCYTYLCNNFTFTQVQHKKIKNIDLSLGENLMQKLVIFI